MATKKTMRRREDTKPIIETMINTCALALTASGTQLLISNRDYFGFLLIGFGAGLEFFKYWGRNQRFW